MWEPVGLEPVSKRMCHILPNAVFQLVFERRNPPKTVLKLILDKHHYTSATRGTIPQEFPELAGFLRALRGRHSRPTAMAANTRPWLNAAGSRFIERMLTACETFRRQKRSIFTYLVEAVAAHLNT